MCGRHWAMVPKHVQRAVWRAYQPGQCDGEPPPSDRWHEAADHAIRIVHEKETHGCYNDVDGVLRTLDGGRSIFDDVDA